MTEINPQSPQDVCDAIADAKRDGVRLEIRGGGSKSLIGAPREARTLGMSAMAGVVDYDPAELVLTVGAGTPLAQIEQLVASERQMLAFEPFDHGPVFGQAAGKATIGGVIAAGVAGSGRVTAGSARDHLLGFTAVSGRGETFVAGGKVVKNVTGFDLSKLVTSSWGRLAAITELTLKVLPKPRTSVTLGIDGLDCSNSCAAMAQAFGSNAEVSAAARHHDGATIFRLTGFEPSIAARLVMLPKVLEAFGTMIALDPDQADIFWRETGAGLALKGDVLWCIHVPPRQAANVIARLEPFSPHWSLDWGGARIWMSLDSGEAPVRGAAEAAGGHAMLIRAPLSMRQAIPVQHPRLAGVAALEARVRRAFDPDCIFETGRFLGEEVAHAD
ncbi:glycolate oxidase FAD binding subunit [Novosphingobium hassiacum]|uniref:Glycolate oxidase FAD binding subunit n=1 Tax=Novosphingobium hassiacum TaxID=173676 RepID=A0A7W5ZUW0_9SPHN|nr:FAD-binding protein [Novosphingobium hassiacum]MBB3860421.1 glycolate oxidase FAD binding subunit [Novosphingobium hassiacum]